MPGGVPVGVEIEMLALTRKAANERREAKFAYSNTIVRKTQRKFNVCSQQAKSNQAAAGCAGGTSFRLPPGPVSSCPLPTNALIAAVMEPIGMPTTLAVAVWLIA